MTGVQTCALPISNTVTASTTPTLGVQQTTQGQLTLANTAVGSFPVTIQSSNSTSAAWNNAASYSVTISAPTADAMRYFFNSGGKITFSASILATGTTKQVDWGFLVNGNVFEIHGYYLLLNSIPVSSGGGNTATGFDQTYGEPNIQANPIGLSIYTGGDHAHDFTTASTGSGTSFNVMTPFVCLNYFIK